MNREAIYAGLWAGLSASVAPMFLTRSRRLEHWNDVLSANQPALFQTSVSETARDTTGQPSRWELRLKLYIYAKWDEGAEVYTLNPLLDAVTAYINQRHPVTGRHPLVGTLPGVETIRIEGVIETDEGVLGDQQVAIVPVVITATD